MAPILMKKMRLRRFDEHFAELNECDDSEGRPPLPQAPEVHPITGSLNLYNPSDPFDPDVEYDVFAFLDRALDKPHRAYLAQWCDDDHRFIASWVWQISLRGDGFEEEMQRIDKWKDEHAHLSLQQFNNLFPSSYAASKSGQCFFEAVRLACIIYGDATLVTTTMIDHFVAENHLDASKGVSSMEIMRFVAFLRKTRASLAVNVFGENVVKVSLNSVTDLNKSSLDPGVYVVGASCARNIKHCFIITVVAGDSTRYVFDDVDDENKDEGYSKEPLSNLTWIRRVGFVRKVERVRKMHRRRKNKNKNSKAIS